MARVLVIAQARMGSSRLPGKVLREAGSLSLLAHLARRLARSETASERVVATTVDPSDDELVEAARALGLRVHRGSVDDVLDRFGATLDALEAAPEDVVVRVTGDCPLLDPGELDRLVHEFLARRAGEERLDYLTNQAGAVRRIPRGLDVEVFTAGDLARARVEAELPGDREHVTPYFYRVAGRFRTAVSDPPGPDYGHLRLTVDTPADLELVDAVVRALGPDATTDAIAAWLAAHPEVAALNAEVGQKSIESEGELRARKVAGRLLLARADAGGTTGFGHVTRVGALLDAWTELGGRAAVVGTGIQGAARERLVAAGVEILDGDDARFDAAIDELEPDALVADGYAFGCEHQRRWQARKPLLAIDDIAAHEQLADLVVNQILGFDGSRYVCAEHTRLLLGHPYVLLRREFRVAATSELETEARAVVVTFGGTDPAGASVPMTRALLASLPPEQPVELIVGGGVAPEVRAELEGLAGRLVLHHDVREMAGLLRRAALVVSAAGTTVWEAMACATPVATLAVADNQRPVVEGIASRGAGLVLGWHESVDYAEAGRTIAELLADPKALERLANKGRATVDGRGVYRVIDALTEVIERRALTRR